MSGVGKIGGEKISIIGEMVMKICYRTGKFMAFHHS